MALYFKRREADSPCIRYQIKPSFDTLMALKPTDKPRVQNSASSPGAYSCLCGPARRHISRRNIAAAGMQLDGGLLGFACVSQSNAGGKPFDKRASPSSVNSVKLL